jgi:hypothetical protein
MIGTPYCFIQELPELLAKCRVLDSSQGSDHYDIATPEEALGVAMRLEQCLGDLGEILSAVGVLASSAASNPPDDHDLHYGLGGLMMMVGATLGTLSDGIPGVRHYAAKLEAEQKEASGQKLAQAEGGSK